MYEFSSSTSFQGVLDSIIRNYLLNELPPEGAENNSNTNTHQAAEKDFGLERSDINLHNGPQVMTANVEQAAGSSRNAKTNISAAANPTDLEYIKAVYQCFEKRGVFKELQTFLRHKLVSILQDEWPDLQTPTTASQEEGPNTTVHRLVEDFLRCHKLLYTLSVLASESHVTLQSSRVMNGKLSSKDAGDILNGMGIQLSSRLSGQIMKCYFDNDNFSLLESMHCLGVWPLEIQLDQLQNVGFGTDQGKSKGTAGESILLSRRSQQEKTVQTTTTALGSKESREYGNFVGVEQKLFEMEKNFERENEFKMTEAIEKYKKDEQLKLRGELETKFKLQLIEKEKEHFLDTQKRINEANAIIQKERLQWLDEKLRQEKELSEYRKQLNEMMSMRSDGNRNQFSTTLPKSQDAATATDAKPRETTSISMDDKVRKCSCKKRQLSQHSYYAEMFSSSPQLGLLAPIEQDRLAFLQYRMEQQDEEIKTLRRQLVQTPQIPVATSKVRPMLSGNITEQTDVASGRPLREMSDGTRLHNCSAVKEKNDLDTFLSASRTRVEKLDNAVEKVDEIVQELLSKRRQQPLSQQLSLQMMSAVANKNKQSLSQLHSYLQHMSTTPIPQPITPISFSTAPPLVHQQIPEKQSACASSSLLQTLPSCNTMYPIYSDLITRPRTHCPSPPLPVSLRERTDLTANSSNKRPETPVDAIFQVAYGQPAKVAEVQESKDILPLATTASLENQMKVDQRTSKNAPSQEESLFFWAAQSRRSSVDKETNKVNDENGRKALEKKALHNGALSREKIFSSDDECRDDNSISLSKSVMAQQNGFQPTSNSTPNNNGNLKITGKALSKSKLYGTGDGSIELPTKAEYLVSRKNERALDNPSQPERLNNSSVASLSTSSNHTNQLANTEKSKVQTGKFSKNANEKKIKQEECYDDDQSSISISAPKSEGGNGDNEDFWQI